MVREATLCRRSRWSCGVTPGWRPVRLYSRTAHAAQVEIEWGQAGRAPYDRIHAELGAVGLSLACNAAVDVLGDEAGNVPLGRLDRRGLPFLIGSEPPSAESYGSPWSVACRISA